MPNPFTDALSRPLRQTDNGLFGPGSPSWKVWTHPTAVIGFQRAVVLEHFDPFLTAAVADQGGIYKDPHGRLDATFAYFLLVALADSRTVVEASQFLMKIHNRAKGIEPVSGKPYSANGTDAQLWIHITGWHSVLKAYEMFGPGKLPAGEEEQFWKECAIAAEFQTCHKKDIPRNRAEVLAYYARVRPTHCVTERALRGMKHLLRPALKDVGFKLWVSGNLIALATVATLPRWMRQLGQIDQPHLVDLFIRPVAKIIVRFTSPPWIRIRALKQVTPLSSQILEQHFSDAQPEKPVTVAPADAFALYGEDAKQAVAGR
jgi:uncharacterized protein (DUF2236 family)